MTLVSTPTSQRPRALSHQTLATILSHPLGTSVHELDFEPDILGDGYTRHTIEIGSDPDGEPGPVVTTLVRYRPEGSAYPTRGEDAASGGAEADADADAEWSQRPALLFVHGMTDFFFQTHVAEHFHARGFAVYAIDLRKCGRSHRDGQTWHHVTSQTIYDEDLSIAVSLLGAGHDGVIPVGHSTGGLDVTMFLSRLHAASQRGDTARAALHGAVRGAVLNSPWLGLQFDKQTNFIIRHIFPLVAKVAPTWHVPGGINPTYGRTLHVSENGEWDYDRYYKPLYPRPKQISWLVGVSREIDKVLSGNWSTGVPTLLLRSDGSSSGRSETDASGKEVPVERAFVTDTILSVRQMQEAAPKVDPDCQVHVIPGAMHDIFLSRPEARADAFAATDEFLAGVVGQE
ncbi:MAG TPA: alpha/beta hydrolase [Candidatus Corynebacterium avicola]|uniref:Alpha/beta hydrolase n=1 Tax=Candidatus Corynebacterium avicola TaxID=2838527 RepID=A0A9D1RQI8_9CORY|nr:alpha/beta hydrolase [Candidatus Corynebacterium avicola]